MDLENMISAYTMLDNAVSLWVHHNYLVEGGLLVLSDPAKRTLLQERFIWLLRNARPAVAYYVTSEAQAEAEAMKVATTQRIERERAEASAAAKALAVARS